MIKKLLLKKGEAFVREMADYISDSKVSYSGNIQAKEIADLIGQSEYHGVFLELLAQSHGRFVYEYCLNDIKCSDCLDDLFDIVERAYDGAGSCEEKKYLLKAAASEAQRISDNDSPVERNRKFLAQIKKHPGVGAFALLPVLEQKYLSQNAVGVPEYQEIRELRLILRECEKITDVPNWLVFYGKLADMYDWAVGREKKLPTELKNSLKEYYTVRTGDNPDFARRLDAWCNWLIKALTGRKRQKAFEWKWICFGCSCDNAEEELYHRFFCDELKRLLREPELKDFLKWFVESKLAELRKTKNKCGKHEKVYQACLNKLKEVMKGTALAWYSPRKSNELLKSFRVRPYREIYEKTVNPENAGTK